MSLKQDPLQSAIEKRFAQLGGVTRPRQREETNEQIEFFRWVQANKAKHPLLDLIHHIPNGEKRDKVTAARLKRMGLKPGVWDVHCPAVVLGGKHGLYIEFKSSTGSATKEQVAFRKALEPLYEFSVCRSWVEAASAVIDFYQLPLQKV